jgi:hypothetical protein
MEPTMGGPILKERKPTGGANGNSLNDAKAVNSNGYHANGKLKSLDHKIDDSGEFEFGGALGTGFVMVFFPVLMWYLWVGEKYYDAQLPLPRAGEPIGEFVKNLYHMAYEVFPVNIFYCMSIANYSYSPRFLTLMLGSFIGFSLPARVSFILPFPVFGPRATPLPTEITFVSITIATQYGHSTSRSSPRLPCT